jgi:hypothetical protein
MSLKEYYKNLDQLDAVQQKQEEQEMAQDQAQKQQKAIAGLKELVRNLLPSLSAHFDNLTYNFDTAGGGAFADFQAEGKKFVLHTRTEGPVGPSRLLLAVRDSGKLRELGSSSVPRKNPIFPENEAARIEREIGALLRKEVGL